MRKIKLLTFLDSSSKIIFIIGMISASMIGLSIALEGDKIKEKETIMSEETESNENIVPLNESFNGILKVSPNNPNGLDKSINGIQNLKPSTDDSSNDSSSSDPSPSDDSGNEDS
ncbi:MAG: hypothetical protein IIB94_11850 [Candidatus Marinimicrobia bacterium]|nr:hypothetical protein [Candidatus Neomarinimicrobiota bacterium]